jgi:hypothetical protein
MRSAQPVIGPMLGQVTFVYIESRRLIDNEDP